VSDAERDAVVAELGEHFLAGRLDQEEFGERMAKALRSRTGRELSELLNDLPPLRETVARSSRSGRRLVYLPVLVPLLFAAVLIAGVAGGADGPHHREGPWVLFPLFWLVAIAVLRFGWWRRSSVR
jgi:hypothetical protein